jgi:uncharacterized repeat protein (TIGR01451 family)
MSTSSHRFWQSFSLFMVLMMLISAVAGGPFSGQAQAQPPTPTVKGSAASAPTVSGEEAYAKLDAYLQNLATASAPAPDKLAPQAEEKAVGVEMSANIPDEATFQKIQAYFAGQVLYGWIPAQQADGIIGVFSGQILPHNLLKVASFGEVTSLAGGPPTRQVTDPVPADDTKPALTPKEWTSLRANAASLRDSSKPWAEAKAIGDGYSGTGPLVPNDWFENWDPTGSMQASKAWARGFQGQGVNVTVIDDGVDFAHPDLMGKQVIYNTSDALHTYLNGYTYVMDAFTLRALFYQYTQAAPYITYGFEGVTLMDTSTRPATAPCGVGLSCFQYAPWIVYGSTGDEHTYVYPTAWSKSGVVHVGTHNDGSLRDYVWGERVSILVTDPTTAGVYDTVYVDLDDDYDFSDEKPVTRANPANPATKNNVISYRDMNGDGKADLSGGALYFIADGANWPGGFDYLFAPSLYGLAAPGNGDMVGLHGPWISGYSHGTQCASNVVASGQTSGMLPQFSDVGPGGTPGTPPGSTYGAAPKAGLVPMNTAYSFTGNSTYRDAYYLAAYGWDARSQLNSGLLFPSGPDTDGIQIASNSYGFSNDFNKGWDQLSYIVEDIMRRRAPYLQFLYSSGNGGPAYGNVPPPKPSTLGISVGASSEYGSTGWDSLKSTDQINFNDMVPFSNAGPSGRQGAGVDILAGGAYAAGAEGLNHFSAGTWGVLDGNLSWDSWGGTSRSTPAAVGALALVYQAYKSKYGVFPTNATAKAIFMSSATDIGNDIFRMGAGVANADKGTLVASGEYGPYMAPVADAYSSVNYNWTLGTESWSPGDYRGTLYPSYAHIVYPGGTYTKTFNVKNPTAAASEVDISATYLQQVGSDEFTYDVTPAMTAAESAYGAANKDNFYKAFNYFIPLKGFGAADKLTIPADTELMIVREILPYDEFDVGNDYTSDNRFYLTVYNWKDQNANGKVWTDKDGNGVVNFINDPSTLGLQADGAEELAWTDARTELERYEFSRFGYNRPTGNTFQLDIWNPLERMQDGMFIGARHLSSAAGAAVTSHLKYRVEYYKRVAAPFLATSVSELDLPAGTNTSFTGTLNVPADMPAGNYAAEIEVTYPASGAYAGKTIIIPVAINVGARFDGDLTLGGDVSAAYDALSPYNNGLVRGFFDWSWRQESGDWRQFFVDIDPAAFPAYDPNATVILKDTWQDAAPHTDIDSVVLGPAATFPMCPNYSFGVWTTSGGCPAFPSAVYGPNALTVKAQSAVDIAGTATWHFNTSSGANTDWLAFPIGNGLFQVGQHNVLFDGTQFGAVFTKTLGMLTQDVQSFSISTYRNAGTVGQMVLHSTLPLDGITVQPLLTKDVLQTWTNEPIGNPGTPAIAWQYDFDVLDSSVLDLNLSSANIADLDLYLWFYDGTKWVQKGSSAGSTATERITISNPDNGKWRVGIDNYSGPAGTFNLTKLLRLKLPGLMAQVSPTGPLAANQPVTVTITYDADLAIGNNVGSLVIGVPSGPSLKTVPVTITKLAAPASDLVKTVDYPMHYLGDTVNYQMDLYNLDANPQTFSFEDAIPAGTTYVSSSVVCAPPAPCSPVVYNAGANKITFEGVLQSSAAAPESFEHAGAWPDGWTTLHSGATAKVWGALNNASYAHTGSYSAAINYDSANASDEYLYTPVFTPTALQKTASFWVATDTAYPTATLTLYAVDPGGTFNDVLWDLVTDENWPTFDYRQKVIDLTAYVGTPIKLAWRYHGLDGDSAFLDDVSLPGVGDPLPAATIQLAVTVNPDDTDGQVVTNQASLSSVHVLPQETQLTYPVLGSALFTVGKEDFSTSSKTGELLDLLDGRQITYTITLANTGGAAALVSLADPIPASTAYLAHDPGYDASFKYDTGLTAMTWSGVLQPGEERVFIFVVTASGPFLSVTNDALVTVNGAPMHLVDTLTTLGETYLPFAKKP